MCDSSNTVKLNNIPSVQRWMKTIYLAGELTGLRVHEDCSKKLKKNKNRKLELKEIPVNRVQMNRKHSWYFPLLLRTKWSSPLTVCERVGVTSPGSNQMKSIHCLFFYWSHFLFGTWRGKVHSVQFFLLRQWSKPPGIIYTICSLGGSISETTIHHL